MLSSCRVTFEDEEPGTMEKWNPDENSVYYRVLSSDDGPPIVAQMQWFDEHGADHDRYLTDERFETEEEAKEFVRRSSVLEISRDEALGILRSIGVIEDLVMSGEISLRDMMSLGNLAERISERFVKE